MPTIMINGKKHTPGSNTLKKMKRKAAMEAAAKAGKPAADKPKVKKPKAKKAKAPVPRPRSERPSTVEVVPKKVVPKSGSKPITKGGRTGDFSKKGAAISAQYIKMRKQLGTGK